MNINAKKQQKQKLKFSQSNPILYKKAVLHSKWGVSQEYKSG